MKTYFVDYAKNDSSESYFLWRVQAVNLSAALTKFYAEKGIVQILDIYQEVPPLDSGLALHVVLAILLITTSILLFAASLMFGWTPAGFLALLLGVAGGVVMWRKLGVDKGGRT